MLNKLVYRELAATGKIPLTGLLCSREGVSRFGDDRFPAARAEPAPADGVCLPTVSPLRRSG